MEMSSCDVSDACDAAGVDAVRTGTLRPVWPGCPPASGRVATFRLAPAAEPAGVGRESGGGRGGTADDPVRDLIAGLDAAREPAQGAAEADIALVDLGGRTDLQCWGGVLARAALRSGFRAAVVHGAVRDVAELKRLRFPVFASGVFPGRARGRLRYAGAGDAVRVVPGGPAVLDGWAVAADASGAVFLPGTAAYEVFAAAQQAGAEQQL